MNTHSLSFYGEIWKSFPKLSSDTQMSCFSVCMHSINAFFSDPVLILVLQSLHFQGVHSPDRLSSKATIK